MTTPLFSPKTAQKVQKVYNTIFHLKGRGDTVLPMTHLDSTMDEFSSYSFLFSPILATFRGKMKVKVGPNLQTLGIFRFCKHSNVLKILKTMFVFPWIVPLVKFFQDLAIFGRVRAQKNAKKGHFMDGASPWKHLKIYNLTTTNAILIKLTTIMYLHENFHSAKKWDVTHRA